MCKSKHVHVDVLERVHDISRLVNQGTCLLSVRTRPHSDFLDFSKISSGMVDLETLPFRMDDLVWWLHHWLVL